MAQLLYIRHGQSTNNALPHHRPNPLLDAHLTALGWQQAIQTAAYLAEALDFTLYSAVRLIVSPYIRTHETLHPLLDHLDTKRIKYQVEVWNLSREYTPPHKIIPPYLAAQEVAPDLNWDDFLTRVTQFNSQLKTTLQPNQLVLIFGHGLFFSALLSYQSNQERSSPPRKSAFRLENCSLSTVEYERNHWRIYQAGQVCHLTDTALSS